MSAENDGFRFDAGQGLDCRPDVSSCSGALMTMLLELLPAGYVAISWVVSW
ncbi:MAG TPA: hypothetical protein VIX60_03180 [Candidatus Cybelea sp.]